jgi:glycosyltransferase involved in cell wall biosynthesis
MNASLPRRILDITRLVGRAGDGPLSGIDRVERAYLAHLAADGAPYLLLCRTALGYLVLGPEAAPILLGWIDQPLTIPPASRLGRLLAHARRVPGIEAALRSMARARLAPMALGGWLAAHLAPGATYLSVGHANLSDRALAQLRRVAGLRIVVMIHDTIPLDTPQFSADRTPAEFRAKLAAACRHADCILCPSAVVAADVGRWAMVFSTDPLRCVAPLGVDLVVPARSEIPPGLILEKPYFVTLGTIEPRKDHALLLDVWDDFHRAMSTTENPQLLILGKRGWKNDLVFRRLDAMAVRNQAVTELLGVSDGGVAALLVGARALLAPSRTEGFGLPAAEAAARGVPVLAADLDVTREVLGDYPIYLPVADKAAWAAKIKAMAQQTPASMPPNPPAVVPDWTAHFNIVFNEF